MEHCAKAGSVKLAEKMLAKESEGFHGATM